MRAKAIMRSRDLLFDFLSAMVLALPCHEDWLFAQWLLPAFKRL
jgi:hypothetical protein